MFQVIAVPVVILVATLGIDPPTLPVGSASDVIVVVEEENRTTTAERRQTNANGSSGERANVDRLRSEKDPGVDASYWN
jgi:hypothetical protein